MLVSQAMHTSVYALNDKATCLDAAEWLQRTEERGADGWSHWQRLFPLVDEEGRLAGALTRSQMIVAGREKDCQSTRLADRATQPTVMSPFTTGEFAWRPRVPARLRRGDGAIVSDVVSGGDKRRQAAGHHYD